MAKDSFNHANLKALRKHLDYLVKKQTALSAQIKRSKERGRKDAVAECWLIRIDKELLQLLKDIDALAAVKRRMQDGE